VGVVLKASSGRIFVTKTAYPFVVTESKCLLIQLGVFCKRRRSNAEDAGSKKALGL
jgi:hypothetical protein